MRERALPLWRHGAPARCPPSLGHRAFCYNGTVHQGNHLEGSHGRAYSRCSVLARNGGALPCACDFKFHEYFGVSFVRPCVHICSRYIGARERGVFGCRCPGGFFPLFLARFSYRQYCSACIFWFLDQRASRCRSRCNRLGCSCSLRAWLPPRVVG